MTPDIECAVAAVVKVARQNEMLLSGADREILFASARRIEALCGERGGAGGSALPNTGTLAGDLTGLVGEIKHWAERAKELETRLAELRWVARTYRDASDEQWGVLEEAKRLDLDISRLPRFESALFRAEAARIAVRRVKL